MVSFPFGLSRDDIADLLVSMADKVRAGTVHVTGVSQNTRNNASDFEVKHLVVRYHEKK